MAPIKIYPPTKLPEKGVTDLLFNIWVEEIEVYLSQDDRFTPFMRGGPYSTWQAYDANADRIDAPQGGDAAAELPNRRAQLRTFLSIVAKACDINHYNVVTRHSTSLQWIYAQGIQHSTEGHPLLQLAGPALQARIQRHGLLQRVPQRHHS